MHFLFFPRKYKYLTKLVFLIVFKLFTYNLICVRINFKWNIKLFEKLIYIKLLYLKVLMFF